MINPAAIVPPFRAHEEGKTPPGYFCAYCAVTGVKLWRLAASSFVVLACESCAFRTQAKQIAEYAHFHEVHGDQIGNCVPAVPDLDGSWWGYTSVPQDAVDWWKSLPTKINDKNRLDRQQRG